MKPVPTMAVLIIIFLLTSQSTAWNFFHFLVLYCQVQFMIVRIRLQKPRIEDPHKLNTLALAASTLTAPSSLLAFTLTLWTITADLGWTGSFFLVHGPFSHWQVWLCTAAVLLFVSRLLDKYVCFDES